MSTKPKTVVPRTAINLKVNVPKAATKQLKIQRCNVGRKLIVSSNWLPLFGFSSGVKVVEELISKGNGIRIRLANKKDAKVKKIYERSYPSRKNNPLESQIDIRGQKLLNEGFSSDAEYVHITFRHGVIEIKPITNKTKESIKRFKSSNNPLVVALACSSGIDSMSLAKNGFEIDSVIEWRPNEARDKKDLTEVGALNALANVKVNYLINEDIMKLDLDRLAQLVQNNSSLFHISLQCDDLSNAKSNSLKEKSCENLTTSLDMTFDCISYISKFMPPMVLVENVENYKNSDAGKMLKARMRKLGYKVTDEVLDARDYSGLTSRKRYYLIGTLLDDEFVMPKATKRNNVPIWDEYIEPYILSGEARLVNHVGSFTKGIEQGRARIIKRDSQYSPTFIKSEDRMAKDSVFIMDEKRDNNLYFPSVEMMAKLMQIPDEYNLYTSSNSISKEFIGQSIEYPMHNLLIEEIKNSLLSAHAKLNNRLF